MPPRNRFSKSEVVHFANECERLLALAKKDGGLTEEEQEALQPYLERLQAIVLDDDQYDSAA